MATDNKYDQSPVRSSNSGAEVPQHQPTASHPNPAGTETLKSLVLPGVGISLLQTLVKESDLGNHFFVTAADLGQSRVCFWSLIQM